MLEVMLSGFLFWLIIGLNLVSDRFGHEAFSDLDADAKLQKINSNPKDFKISVALILVENITIIVLAVTLFVAFSSYSMILAVVWTISRAIEGLIQVYNKKSYFSLLGLAKKYTNAIGTEKSEFTRLGRSILKTKNTVFTFAQVLFSVGTLSYSIIFATSGVMPDIIGWFGVVASIIYGIGSGIKLAKTNFKALWGLGGLLILVFEFILGGWLLFSTFF